MLPHKALCPCARSCNRAFCCTCVNSVCCNYSQLQAWLHACTATPKIVRSTVRTAQQKVTANSGAAAALTDCICWLP
jgi:hypothetical protein